MIQRDGSAVSVLSRPVNFCVFASSTKIIILWLEFQAASTYPVASMIEYLVLCLVTAR